MHPMYKCTISTCRVLKREDIHISICTVDISHDCVVYMIIVKDHTTKIVVKHYKNTHNYIILQHLATVATTIFNTGCIVWSFGSWNTVLHMDYNTLCAIFY